jgi:PAS domain S-box-containing protein
MSVKINLDFFPTGLSIAGRVLWLALGVFLAAMSILLVFLYGRLSTDLTALVVAEQQQKAQIVVSQIAGALDERQRVLVRLSTYLHDGQTLLPPEKLQATLDPLILVQQFFNAGTGVFNHDAIGIAELPKGTGRIGLDVSDREHTKEVRRTLKPVISPPLLSRSLGKPSFFVNVPILNDRSEILGFLIGVTRLEAENFLISIPGLGEKYGNESPPMTYVLDTENRLIVTASDFSMAMQPFPEPGQSPVFDALLRGERAGLVRSSSGNLIYASQHVPKMGWTVVQTISDQSVMGPVWGAIHQVVLLALLVMLIAAFFLRWVLGRVLAPLREAANSVEAMVEGSRAFSPIPVHRPDEAGQLVRAFNHLLYIREEQRQRLYLATSGTGLGIWDYHVPENRLIWDENMYRLYGVQPHTFGGAYEAWQAGVHPDDIEVTHARLQEALEGGRPFEMEFRVIHPDETIHWIQASSIVVRDENGSAIRMIGTNWDTTERKKVERMKNQFVATVSHELRTPLTSIRGAVALVGSQRLCPLSDQAVQLLNIANKNCERLTALINDLLDIEKMASGQMVFSFELIDIKNLLTTSIEANRPYANEYGVSFILEPVAPGLCVHCDTQRLLQVLANLLSNAAKFSPQGGKVHVHAEKAAHGRIRVSVCDQGPGVPNAFRGRIFQRFSQADASDTRQKGGTGLGLAISREIIRKMGGDIGFESEEGQGATFYFELPHVSMGPATVA